MSQLPPEEPVDRREVVRSSERLDPEVDTRTDRTGVVREERYTRDVAAEQVMTANRLSQVVWLLVGIVEILLALRVVLELIGANAGAGFAQFVYGASEPFLAPFYGLTGTPAAGPMVLDVPAIIAMVVYALLGWLVVRVIWLIFTPTTARTSSSQDHYRDQ